MKKLQGVTNSTEINRKNILFPVETLESALNQTWEKGIPFLIDHDLHRPRGWAYGLALYLEPYLGRSTASFYIPEDTTETEKILKALNIHWQKKINEINLDHLQKLKSLIEKHLTKNARLHDANSVCFIDKGIVNKIFPEIFSKKDKDGLIPIQLLSPKSPGIFEKDGLLIFAHPYFRRSLSRYNNFNSEFLSQLQNCKKKFKDIKISLDEDMIGLSESFVPSIELDYWRGPKFSDNLLKIPTGVTIHTNSEVEKESEGISRTEFGWYIQDGKQTFECEEIKDIPSCGVSKYMFGCRFIHSIIDEKTGKAKHLDGAIRLYNEETMIKRLDTDIKKFGRNSQYTKLWRIDDLVEVDLWKSLIADYYRGNSLIEEYFEGKNISKQENIISIQDPKIPLYEYVPCHLDAGDGIKISISYHSKTEKEKYGRIIQSFDVIGNDLKKYNYIEADTIEIIKRLRKKGESVNLPDGISYIAFEDMVINFPLFLHTGDKGIILAEQTNIAFSELLDDWRKRKDDRLVSYNIGVEYTNKIVYFSYIGHIQDLKIWMDSNESQLPKKEDDLGNWCEKALSFITDKFPKPKFDTIWNSLKENGLLIFERRLIDEKEKNELSICYDKGLHCQMDLANNKQKFNDIVSYNLTLAPIFLIKKSSCSACTKNYRECNCSKYRDKGTCQKITDSEIITLFWTNRNASN